MPDLVGRRFTTDRPNHVYVGDITYLPCKGGKNMYLATVIDVYSRKLVGHALADHMRVSLVIEALSHARKAQDLAAIAYTLNNRPRKVLGFRTPAEVFNEQLQSIQNNSVATTD